MNRTLGIFLFLYLPLRLLGQPACNDYFFQNLTTVDGLSQNSVSMVMQDRQGFVWVTSQNGVDKYIGTSFIPALGYEKSLFEKITCLYDWSKDYILVCTDERNLLLHKWQQDVKKSISLKSSLTEIVHIARMDSTDEKHQLLAFSKNGIYFVDNRFKRTELVNGLVDIEIMTVLPNPRKKGQFFIGTKNGVLGYDLNTRGLTTIWEGCEEVRALFLNKNSNLYFGGKTRGNIYRFIPSMSISNSNPSAISLRM
ncbi:MAG: hypothetical protein IPN76_18695 [Saprospiraceae bacterium]|nr:hypothetical protein [Saprospiraceae bacterium]